MFLKEMTFHQAQELPQLNEPPTFVQRELNPILLQEILARVGEDNLDYAIAYGSQGTKDASANSMFDVMVVVRDVKAFYDQNLASDSPYKSDFGRPHRPGYHTFLNRFGFNFYHTHLIDEQGQTHGIKLAVISTQNFIVGCHGTLHYREQPKGAFGMYVAGRVQKVALTPLHKHDVETSVQIEDAINAARIDGVWLTLGRLHDHFTYDELLYEYVSLSYKADARLEKKGKVERLIENNYDDYLAMLLPIIAAFIDQGLLSYNEEGFQKIKSLSKTDTEFRLKQLREISFLLNYVKNPLTPGVAHGFIYLAAKMRRIADSYRPKTT